MDKDDATLLNQDPYKDRLFTAKEFIILNAIIQRGLAEEQLFSKKKVRYALLQRLSAHVSDFEKFPEKTHHELILHEDDYYLLAILFDRAIFDAKQLKKKKLRRKLKDLFAKVETSERIVIVEDDE